MNIFLLCPIIFKSIFFIFSTLSVRGMLGKTNLMMSTLAPCDLDPYVRRDLF